jgi:phospholipid/cholesterol/gamma-HCH transport system permease protein
MSRVSHFLSGFAPAQRGLPFLVTEAPIGWSAVAHRQQSGRTHRANMDLGERITLIGGSTRRFIESLAALWRLARRTVWEALRAPFRRAQSFTRRDLLVQFDRLGGRSLNIAVVVVSLVAVIVVLQSGALVRRYGQVSLLEPLVGTLFPRELGALMVGIVLVARVGASLIAEFATMRSNDELLALEAMGVDPIRYLVTPRFLALTIMGPCITVIGIVVGMVVASITSAIMHHTDIVGFLVGAFEAMSLRDVLIGLLKSFTYSALIALIACHVGLTTGTGAERIGLAIRTGVVAMLIAVIFAAALITLISELLLRTA